MWVFFIIFLTACTYLGLSVDIKDLLLEEKETTEDADAHEDEAFDVDAIIEEYFASKPVRDVPKDADMTSFLIGNLQSQNGILKKRL